MLALAIAPLALAAHPTRVIVVRANHDSDGRAERLGAEAGASADHSQFRARVFLEDFCPSRWTTYELSGVHEFLDAARVVEADGRAPREVFFWLHSRGGGGIAAVTRLRPRPPGCPAPVTIFVYSPTDPPLPPPPGYEVESFSAAVGDYAARFRGKEVRLVEVYAGRPALQRVSSFRYARERARYVRYSTKLSEA